MICRVCRCQDHVSCRGGTWCCCQHRTRVKTVMLGPFEPERKTVPNGEQVSGYATASVSDVWPASIG